MANNVLPFDEALNTVLAEARKTSPPSAIERVPLLEAAGRVLAKSIEADRDQPPFDRSTRDGFAVRSADITPGATLRIAGSIRAGEHWTGAAIRSGEAIEIMTGAPLPAGADAVLMLEHVSTAAQAITVQKGRPLTVGQNVVPRGAEARAGDTVLPVGRVMHAAEIAVAASCGCGAVDVFQKPHVAIVATGDELVELDQPIESWQIRNSNSYALAALVAAEGAIADRMPIARDTLEDLRTCILAGREADLLLLSGGVSMGKFDLVEQVLAEIGAEFFFSGALIQPGKPIVFGRLPKANGEWTYFFGLPGNPVSTQVCFHLFVAPFVRAMAGRTEIAPQFVEARLAEDTRRSGPATKFLPAELIKAWDGVQVRTVGWQGSGDVAGNARGDCYLILPSGVDIYRAGETVRVMLR